MRKSIRLHPWRLEIVPALAVGTVLVYALRAWLDCNYWPPEHRELQDELLGLAVASGGMILFLWLTEFGVNSHWVRRERRKRFNGMVPLFQSTIVIQAFVACYILVFLREWPFRVHKPGLGTLALFAISAAAVATILEWMRKYEPRETEPGPPPRQPLPEHVDDQFTYRETQLDWWNTAAGFVWFIAFVVVWLLGVSLRDCLMTLLLSVACVVFGLRVVSITGKSVKLWLGPARWRFPLAEIESCDVVDHEPRSTKRDKRYRVFGANGRCVELTLRNGRIYRLGAIRPQHIVDLICRLQQQTL